LANNLFYRGPTLVRLHEDWAKQGKIDENAPITTASSIDIHAPIARVWECLIDLPNWPIISTAFQNVELDSTVAVDATFRFILYSFPIRARFAVVNPPHQLVWTGTSLWFKAVDSHKLATLPNGDTRYTVAESFAGVLATLFTNGAQLAKQHRTWMEAFKREVEE
jgi:hypothetical protein